MNALPHNSNGPLPGTWNDGKTAVSHPVALFHHPHHGELRICAAGSVNALRPLAVWRTGNVRVLSGGLPGKADEPLRLAVEPDAGQRLTVEGARPGAVLAAWMRGPQAERRARLRRRWLLGTAAVWAVCLGLYFSSPLLFSLAAGVIPQRWEQRMGESARDSLVDMLLVLPGVRSVNERAGRDPALQGLLARLENGAPAKGYVFDLMMLDADFVNAFALPGGFMLVSTGLVAACESPDELAGVLAHEMAHVTGRHGTGRLMREQAWSFFVRLMSGGDSLTAKLLGTVVTSSFDRDDERDADARGVARLVGAGISPMGLADFFARLEKEEKKERAIRGRGFTSYIASHPPPAERRDTIRRNMESAAGQGAPAVSPAMTAEEWRKFRTVCGLPDAIPGGISGATGEKARKAPAGSLAPAPRACPELAHKKGTPNFSGSGHGRSAA